MSGYLTACCAASGGIAKLLRRPVASLILIFGTGFAFSCHADTFVREDIIVEPEPGNFNICFDNGCASLAWVKLNAEQWQRLRAVFSKPADTPAEERGQIRVAVALFETIVGAMTGTASDKGGNWKGFGLPGQMDCIDESINTTVYLRMLQKYGLLRWHSVADRSTRWSLFTWPHTTAVIEEGASRRRWAVDSWFLDNGEPPFVLPLETWKDGWKPFQKNSAEPSGKMRD